MLYTQKKKKNLIARSEFINLPSKNPFDTPTMNAPPAQDVNRAVPDDMDDMERQVFGTNVHTNDAMSDARLELDSDFSLSGDEEDDVGDAFAAKVHEQEQETWGDVLSQRRPKHNTGGKGVLADYNEAKKITRRRNETKVLKQREAWKRAGGAAGIPGTRVEKGNKVEEDEDEEDQEDDFFEKYRRERLLQLSSVAGLPQFGKLLPVTKFEFVDYVDQANSKTFVVIHLYEDYLIRCERMNHILKVLAERYPHVMFLKLRATEADQTLSHSVLPAFLVYKAGQLTGDASINASESEFQNEKFSEEDVEFFFVSKYGVHLPGVDVSAKERMQAQAKEAADASSSNVIMPRRY